MSMWVQECRLRHTALQNLRRRIDNPGADSEFISLNSFNKKVHLPDFDVIFVDECSIIDNRTMVEFLEKASPNAFLVFAGDILSQIPAKNVPVT